jgi:hypothetical protein
MKETGTFLPGATLAIAVAIPLAAVGAVVLSPEGEAGDRVPCDGCGGMYAPEDLTAGEIETRWCASCIDARAAFDCVQEDDGEP